MQDFRKLRVWDRSIRLAVLCYDATSDFPPSERYGLVAQMRRAAVSIGSNIAEGCGRGSAGDFVRFLRIAYGSACELETQARIAAATSVGDPADLEALIDEVERVRRMLAVLAARVASEAAPPAQPQTVNRDP